MVDAGELFCTKPGKSQYPLIRERIDRHVLRTACGIWGSSFSKEKRRLDLSLWPLVGK